MGRKWNVIIRGIEGDMKQLAINAEGKVMDFLTKKVQTPPAPKVGLDGPFSSSSKVIRGTEGRKSIIVRFVNRDNVILRAKAMKKGSGFSVVPDLCPGASRKRTRLLQSLKSMYELERKNIDLYIPRTLNIPITCNRTFPYT